jgi:branched-chain amino acid aminotransferase
MAQKIYISGKFYCKEDAKISVYDHGLLYGDGVFEGIRSYGGKVFRLADHLDRLWESAKAIWLEIPMSKAEMTKAIEDTLAANGVEDGYIRVVVTRGAGTLGLDPNRCSNPQVIVIADHIALYPKEYYENGLEIITVSVMRNHSAALSPRIKSLNYLNNILAKIDAQQAGAHEAIMLNAQGLIAECTADNLFVVRNGQLLTPSPQDGALEGITRGVILELAGEARIPAAEAHLSRYDLYTAEEAFVTGTGAELMPVIEVDGRTVGDGKPGPLTRRLLDAYRAAVPGYCV